jgi:type II secretory pathway pseudopilin PulG
MGISSKALTMIEVIMMVTLLGIVLFLTLPRLATSRFSNEQAVIKAKALQLNAAKDAFVALRGVSEAQDEWDDTKGDAQAEWVLVEPFLPEAAQKTYLNYTSLSSSYFGLQGYFIFFNSDIVTAPVHIYVDSNLDGTYTSGTDEEIAYR